MKVSVEDLPRLIAEELENYSEEVNQVVENTITNVAKEALQAVKDSPDLKNIKGNAYKNSFFIKNEYKTRGKNKGFYKLRIANKEYRITHLLEHGHVTLSGGRTRAFSHWINGQKVADTLPDRIKEAIEK